MDKDKQQAIQESLMYTFKVFGYGCLIVVFFASITYLIGLLEVKPKYVEKAKSPITFNHFNNLDVETFTYSGCRWIVFKTETDIDVEHSPTCTNFHSRN